MSRHDGVSCDSCMKGNFRGRRYKCLVCCDCDLCANCYEAGASTTRHLADHPMQCILTRSDFELYYGGEGVSIEQPQSLTCPYCTRMGFTETTLQEHVAADHSDTSFEVICPVCAYLPGGEANLVTDDIAGHLTLEHRSGPRDLITFLDESSSSRHGLRRITHTNNRGVNAPRPRRSNMHFSSSGGLSPSSREGIDPIADLLSQLSSVRRAGNSSSSNAVPSSAPSQLQQLQMQLQLERQQVRAARQQLERLPKRTQAIGSVGSGASTSGNHSATMSNVVANNTAGNNNVSSANLSSAPSSSSQNSTFLLPRCIASTPTDSQLQSLERETANRSLFARELVVATLVQALPDLTQHPDTTAQTPISPNLSSAHISSPETPGSTAAAAGASSASSDVTGSRTTLVNGQQQQQQHHQQQQDGRKDQQQSAGTLSKHQQQHSSSNAAPHHQHVSQSATNANCSSGGAVAAAAVQSQNLAPAVTTAQNNTAPMVQTLMHVIPQPLVLQQPLPPPVRNTGTGTIREQMSNTPPSNAYLRGGVGPVSVTGTSRRKPVRAVDGRNQSTEPPPPH